MKSAAKTSSLVVLALLSGCCRNERAPENVAASLAWVISATPAVPMEIDGLVLNDRTGCLIALTVDGEVHSTLDAGSTWTQRSRGPFDRIASGPGGQPLYALYTLGTTGVSFSNDDGATWRHSGIADEDTLVGGVVHAFTRTVFVGVAGVGLHSSADVGETWQRVDFPGPQIVSSLAYRSSPPELCVDTWEGLLFTSDGKGWSRSVSGTSFRHMCYTRSRDDSVLLGATGDQVWRQAAEREWTWYAPRPGKDVNCLVADPQRPGLVYAGTDEGLFVSGDTGLTWASIPAASSAPIRSVAIGSGPSSLLYVGSTKGLSVLRLVHKVPDEQD